MKKLSMRNLFKKNIFNFFTTILVVISSFFLFSIKSEEEKYSYLSFDNDIVEEIFYNTQYQTDYSSIAFDTTYASLYFSNLKQNIPFNFFNSCGYVALSMYLSFMDTSYNDNVIDEKFSCDSSIVEKEIGIYSNSYEWYFLEHESPGVIEEDFGMFQNLSLRNFMSNLDFYSNRFFQPFLINLFKNNPLFMCDYVSESLGLSYNGLKSLLSLYLFDHIGFSHSMFSINEGKYSTNIYQFVREQINIGIPVIVFLENDMMSHIAIAYDFDQFTGEIFVHSGWKNENNKVINRLPIYEMDFTITNALSVTPTVSDHCHIYHYIDSNSSNFCYCKFATPSFVSVNNLYVDTTPYISWENYYIHPSLNIYNNYHKVYLSSISNGNAFETIISHNSIYIDYDQWLSLFSDFENNGFVLQISFYSSASFLNKSTRLIYQLNYDSDKAYIIYPSSYYQDVQNEEFPNFPLTPNDYLNLDIQSHGITISSSYVMLNPIANDCSSYIHYYFDKPISRFDLNAGFKYFKSDFLEMNASLVVQTLVQGQWYNYYDVFSNILFLSTNNSNTVIMPIYFYEPVEQIRLFYEVDESFCSENIQVILEKCIAYSYEDHIPGSGAELNYEPHLWNGIDVRQTNCYAYALNDKTMGFANLGDTAYPGINAVEIPNKNNQIYINLLIDDVRAMGKGIVQLDSQHSNCVNGGYRIAFCAYTDLTGYHFYRQNKDGTWSHKSGMLPVTNKDYSGNIIYDVEKADRNLKHSVGFNYNILGYFEIFEL